MEAGLQIFDSQGSLIVDVGSRLARFMGSVNTGNHSGAIHVPGFNTGEPFYVSLLNTPTILGTVAGPTIWTSGLTLHWAFDLHRPQSPVTIIYGVF